MTQPTSASRKPLDDTSAPVYLDAIERLDPRRVVALRFARHLAPPNGPFTGPSPDAIIAFANWLLAPTTMPLADETEVQPCRRRDRGAAVIDPPPRRLVRTTTNEPHPPHLDEQGVCDCYCERCTDYDDTCICPDCAVYTTGEVL